jgi:ubiquinone/menaquinone biosynthesis C-methylase UbiE
MDQSDRPNSISKQTIALPSNAQPEELNPVVRRREAGDLVAGEDERLRCELEAEELRIHRVYADRNNLIPADRYSSRNLGNLFIQRELERHLQANLRRVGCRSLDSKEILDVGCGSGFWLQKLVGWGAKPQNLFGIDLRPAGIEEARRGTLKDASLEVGNATQLGFDDQRFDLVLQFAVFSSVLHGPSKHQIASEMIRVLKPGGHIIWYDFFVDNPWNPNVQGVGKREISELFPSCLRHIERVTVAPPLTRRMGRLAPVLYPVLARIRICSTHYLGFFENEAGSRRNSTT